MSDHLKLTITREAALKVLGANGERWIKGWGYYKPDVPDEEVKTCVRGMIRRCSPQPGDGYIIEQVEIQRGFGDAWNDASARTWSDIDDHLANGIEVTDDDLRATFGPQWREIVALVRRAAALDEPAVSSFGVSWTASWTASWDASWDAAMSAPPAASAWIAAVDAAWGLAGAIAGTAASALVVRHLIGQRWFTQEYYDVLTGPCRRAMGRIHPDDAELEVEEASDE